MGCSARAAHLQASPPREPRAAAEVVGVINGLLGPSSTLTGFTTSRAPHGRGISRLLGPSSILMGLTTSRAQRVLLFPGEVVRRLHWLPKQVTNKAQEWDLMG